ncbi:MAG: ABC transporter permease [Microbacteriaceae bacterium]
MTVAAPPARSGARRRMIRPSAVTVLAALYVAILVVALVHPPLLGAADPNTTDPVSSLRPPSAAHWFGTDELGRDIYARVVYGARYSVIIAALAVALGLAGGIVLGLLAALTHRAVDELLSRVFDLLSAFPSILMALLFATFFGAGTVSLTLAIGIALIPGFARLIRRQAAAIRGSEYVSAARTLGQRYATTVVRHILPNAVSSVLLLATIEIGTAILTVSGLSFVGLGPARPAPEWGALLSAARDYISLAWWPTVFPGLAIVVTILAITTLGRAAQRRFQGRRA